MLKSPLSEADFNNYTWPDNELARFNAYMAGTEPLWQPPGAGHNQPPPEVPPGPEAKKARFLAELEDWTTAAKAHREQDAIDRKALKALDRLHAHRRAELEGVVRYCRQHPHADATIATFTLIVLLSDNDEYGACYLSIPRMAELLSRTKDCIRDCIDRLVESALIGSKERSGGTTLHWPLVHESFGDKPSLPWLVDHYSPTRRLGRPNKKPLRPEAEGFSGDPSGETPGGFSRSSENPSGARRETPQERARDDSSLDASKGKKTPPSKVAGLTQEEVDAGFAEWWAHYPRKDDKLDAKKAYTTIVTGKHKDPECRATIPQLLAALKAHKFPKDREFTKLPATWLNKGSWASDAVDGLGAEDTWVAEQMCTARGIERIQSMGRESAEKVLRDAYRNQLKQGGTHAN